MRLRFRRRNMGLALSPITSDPEFSAEQRRIVGDPPGIPDDEVPMTGREARLKVMHDIGARRESGIFGPSSGRRH